MKDDFIFGGGAYSDVQGKLRYGVGMINKINIF